ncbi:DNA topoisomerase VI subunit B [Candidatus Woesearchaeota archaeon]|nr:DNA topoisomerase VI subunit B [Candidatus Woesearchaeota archaeon]
MTTAEELAKKQREVSVAEFFERNRHLLGFDNKRKALLTVVKEAVDNSLTHDMPLLIKEKGKIKIVKIGSFIDERISKFSEKKEVLRNKELERLPLDENVEVLAFDKKTLKIDFRKVSTLFRHKVNSKIYRVKLTSGRYVDLTAYHSVFTLDKGKVVSIPTAELKKGMPIVVPRTSWRTPTCINEINLIEELLFLDPSLTSKINIYGVNNLLTDITVRDIRKALPESKQYRINDFKKLNYLPLNILRKLQIDINKFSDSKLGESLSRHKIPVIIKIDHNFAELLGLYVAEGSMLKSLTRLHFSFGSHEKELIYYLRDLFEKVFKFLPMIRKAHKSAYNVISNSTILCFIFKHVLDVGENARTKKIPEIVFNFDSPLKHSFLLAYLTGDGYPSKELFYLLKNDLPLNKLNVQKITCATASFELCVQLQYLLSSLGLNYSTRIADNKSRFVNGVFAKFGKSFYVYIYSDNRKNAMNFLPIDQSIIGTTDSKLNYSISRSNQTNVHLSTLNTGLSQSTLLVHEGLRTFLEGDLGVLRITSIEEIDYDHEWVYDVSVPECENFVAGVGAIICHNSLDACEEAKVLPEIKIEIIDMENERFRVVVEDNGPGIIKKQIPRIFGKLLYGSKFFSRKQSLTGDEPIILKKDGKIQIKPIGELIDKINGNKETKNVEQLNIQVPAFDRKTLKYSFKTVSHLIKHKRENEICEIELETGRKIKVTGCHSIFGISNLEIKEIEARQLKEGDYLCAPSIIPLNDEVNEISILDYIDENKVKNNYWYIYNIPEEIIKEVFSKAKTIHKKTDKSRKYYQFRVGLETIDVLEDSYKYNYLKNGFIPVYLYKKLNLKIPEAKIRTYFHGKSYDLSIVWPITKMLSRFLGFYVAEGHCDNRQIGFTFNEDEKEFVKEITDFALFFGLNYTIERRPEKSCVRVKVFGGVLSELIKKWCGKGAKNKIIPDFIFTTNSQNKQHFLDAYYQGDGHLFKKSSQLTATTVSEKLAQQLIYLWLIQGVVASIRKKEFKGLGKNLSTGYTVDIYGDSINNSFVFKAKTEHKSKFSKIPINSFYPEPKRISRDNILSSLGFEHYQENDLYPRLFELFNQKDSFKIEDLTKITTSRHAISFLEKKGILKQENGLYILTAQYYKVQEILEKASKLVDSDFVFLKVKKISKITEGYEYVYDISVPEAENFVGGLGGISCHNSRGQQGIGISAALLYAQLTTGRPAKITSKTGAGKEASYFELRINTQKNEPEILKEEVVNFKKDHGTRVEMDFEASYQKGDQSVDAYVKETAIVNPHATFIYTTPKAEQFVFARVTENLPIEPKEVKPHPYGVEHGILTKMLASTQSRTLQSFLTTEFSRVGGGTAKEICDKAGLQTDMKPSELNHAHVDKLMTGIRETKIIAPSSDCLSPIGEELLEKGLRKEVNAEFYTAVSRSPSVYRGIPFVIEVSAAYGGEQPADEPIKLLRYANRVPLLYQQGACATFKSVISTAWRGYGLQQSSGSLPQGPLTLVIHLASVWPPFTSEAKEALAHYPEIIREIKLALQEIGRKLGSYVNKKRRAGMEQERVNIFERYIPEVADSLSRLTGDNKTKLIESMKKMLEKNKEFIQQNKGELKGEVEKPVKGERQIKLKGSFEEDE